MQFLTKISKEIFIWEAFHETEYHCISIFDNKLQRLLSNQFHHPSNNVPNKCAYPRHKNRVPPEKRVNKRQFLVLLRPIFPVSLLSQVSYFSRKIIMIIQQQDTTTFCQIFYTLFIDKNNVPTSTLQVFYLSRKIEHILHKISSSLSSYIPSIDQIPSSIEQCLQ